MTSDDRAIVERMKGEIAAVLASRPGERKAVLAVVAKLLLAYPLPGSSEAGGQARAAAYEDALDDVPSWAVKEAVRLWNRGESGLPKADYHWPPAPAELRQVCLRLMEPGKRAVSDLQALLDAKPLEELMASPGAAGSRPPLEWHKHWERPTPGGTLVTGRVYQARVGPLPEPGEEPIAVSPELRSLLEPAAPLPLSDAAE